MYEACICMMSHVSLYKYVCETWSHTVMTMNICRVWEQGAEEDVQTVQTKPKYQIDEGNCVTKNPLDGSTRYIGAGDFCAREVLLLYLDPETE